MLNDMLPRKGRIADPARQRRPIERQHAGARRGSLWMRPRVNRAGKTVLYTGSVFEYIRARRFQTLAQGQSRMTIFAPLAPQGMSPAMIALPGRLRAPYCLRIHFPPKNSAKIFVVCILWRINISGAGRCRSDTPALWRDRSGAEWAGPTGPQNWVVLCRQSAQVTVLCSLAVRRKPRPTWSLRRVEPGQAGDGAAQTSRNREFLDRRLEQWLPFCRCAYLDCAAQLLPKRGACRAQEGTTRVFTAQRISPPTGVRAGSVRAKPKRWVCASAAPPRQKITLWRPGRAQLLPAFQAKCNARTAGMSAPFLIRPDTNQVCAGECGVGCGFIQQMHSSAGELAPARSG